MIRGNWKKIDIYRVILTGSRYPAPNKPNPQNPAVRYEDHTQDRYLVIDTATKKIIQLSGPRFRREPPP